MRTWLCIFAALWIADTLYIARMLLNKGVRGEIDDVLTDVALVLWFLFFAATIATGVWCSLQR